MLSAAYSAGLCGIDGFPVTVECNRLEKLEGFELVGLPDAAVKEAKERVWNACANSGFPFPYSRITVNLAPADRKKEGSAFDAAILTAIFHSSGVIRREVELRGRCIVGELSLSGELRSVRGVLSMCLSAKEAGFREFYAPEANAAEAAVVEGITVFAVPDMRSLVRHLNGEQALAPVPRPLRRPGRIFSTCAGRRLPSVQWRSRRRAGTICCSSGRPAAENPCWRAGFPPFSRR